MSHNLNIDKKTGEAALYLLQQKAWHGLGQIVQEAQSSDEVIKIAHLDWEVEKIPNTVLLPGKGVVNSGSYSIVRKDTEDILHSTALAKYTPVQNSVAFKYMDSLVRFAKDIVYETAGALGKGETVFVSAKLPGYIRIAGTDDIIEKYLLWYNSHSGGALSCFLTDVRVVCQNTLSAAIGSRGLRNGFSFKHTSGVLNRLEEAGALMNLINTYNDEFGQILNQLVKIQVEEKFAKDFLNQLFLTPEELQALGAEGLPVRKQNIMDQVYAALYNAPGQNMHQGSALWLYNGVTSYFQNVKSYRSPDRKMAGINFGGEEAVLTQKAFNSLVSLMQ